MKYFYYTCIVVLLGLIVYNITELTGDAFLATEDLLSYICILSAFCGLLLSMIMLKISKAKRPEKVQNPADTLP